MNQFKEYYQKTREKIEKKLEEFNQKMEKEKNPLLKENYKLFTNLNRDGKLVRGTLVNLGYSILKEDADDSLDLSLAYEVFQTGILIHDDVIDKDNTRRGKETIHYANYKKYETLSAEKEEAKHLGDSIAICMGDYGLYEANKIISEKYQSSPNLGKVLVNFNNTVLTTIRGELLDVILPFQGKYNQMTPEEIEKNILEIDRLKTAYYTIIGPMSAGILLAGGTDEMIKEIESFGEKVGIAFQIQDDILGIYSNEIGKVKGSDIKECKQTTLYAYTLKTKYKEKLMKVYGKEEIKEEDILKVQEIFQESGAYSYAVSKMNELYDESLTLLESYKWIKEEKKELLRGFVKYLRERNK